MVRTRQWLKRSAALAATVTALMMAMGTQTASADFCSDYGLCNSPRYTVYYNYDWYWSGPTLRWYQIRTCYWRSSAGYVYAISYC